MQPSPAVPPGINSHFASTFLAAQQLIRPDSADKTANYPGKSTVSPANVRSPIFGGSCNLLPASSTSSFSTCASSLPLDFRSVHRGSLTKTLHLQNVAADSQPGLNYVAADSQQYGLDSMEQRTKQSGKRKQGSRKEIRRTQSELEVGKSHKHSFRSLKRAFSPFLFRSRKKEAPPLDEVKKVYSTPVAMETGFPVVSPSDLADSAGYYNGSACVRGLVSPLVHPRSAITSSHRGSLTINDSNSSARPESRLSRKRASPRVALNSSPAHSPRVAHKLLNSSLAHSLDSVKSRTPERKLSTPGSTLERKLSGSTSQGTPPSWQPPTNFTGDHAKETLVKPTAVRPVQLQNSPPRKCWECNSVIPSDPPSDPPSHAPSDPPSHAPSHAPAGELQDILKKYSPAKPAADQSASLHRKLKEIKQELEDYRAAMQDNPKIGQIKQDRESLTSSGSAPQYHDEVFYKTDKEMFDSTMVKPAEDDYYKEIEVRINPEGIAVVRRRHRALPDSDRPQDGMRRSTIHVDDRVFCDKAVLKSIYGHSPAHATRATASHEEAGGLRPFIHQKSVPNLFGDEAPSSLAELDPCTETARLKREFHRSNASNLPIHKKYIRAYTKFYERKLALKLLALDRFIQQEKETKVQLDEKIRRSLLENDELLKSLNSAKRHILDMIEDIETPV